MPVFPYRGGVASLFFRRSTTSRAGQSLIESCLVLIIVCLAFFGVFQISQLFARQEVLHYAAARGARAKVVGFNQFMVFKTIRVGAIPNVGRLINPISDGGPAAQHAVEAARIPLYMGTEDASELDPILDYQDWDTAQDVSWPLVSAFGDGTLRLRVGQQVPLRYPFHRAFYAADSMDMTGESWMDNHYTLYLDDRNW
ncbi:MAG: TadE family protein [bacterium]